LKIKTIFVVFNLLLLASFAVVFFMPLFILGRGQILDFWGRNLFLVLAFLLVFVAFNLFFLSRWRLHSLLEAEDWRGIRDYLEGRLQRGGGLSSLRLRILINTYFILADMEGLARLEALLRERGSRRHAAFGLELGLPYLMRNDPAGEAHFAELARSPGLRKKDWVLWSLAFCRASRRDMTGAEEVLQKLAPSAADPIVASLALFLLDGLPGSENAELVREGRKKLRAGRSAGDWDRLIEKSKENLEVLVLIKLVRRAADWLYADAAAVPGGVKG